MAHSALWSAAHPPPEAQHAGAPDARARLAAAVGTLQRRWGAQALERASALRVRRAGIATGCEALDGALPAGGFPRGRLVECAAPLSAGATTFALRAIAHAQRHGLRAAYLDLARTFDPLYAAARGVVLERLVIAHPQNGREALDIADALADCVDLLLFDSSGALAAADLAPAARAAGLRRLARRLPLASCALVFLTHQPDAASIVSRYAAVRLQFTRARLQTQCGRFAGGEVRVRVCGHALRGAATVTLDLSDLGAAAASVA